MDVCASDRAADPHSGRGRFLFRAALATALVLHIAAFAYSSMNPGSRWMGDTEEYLDAAANLLSEGVIYSGDLAVGVPVDPTLYSRRPPLYPLLLALSEVAVGGTIGAVLAQMLMTVAGASLTWRIAGLMGAGKRAARLAPLLYLAYPAQLIYTQVLMAEVLFQFVLTVSVFLLLRYLQHRSLPDLYSYNLAVGAAALCKPVMMFFWIPNLLFCLWLWLSKRHQGWHLWVAPLVPLVLVSGWSLRNYELTGSYHFSSMGTAYLKLLTRDRLVKDSDEFRDLGVLSGDATGAFLREVPDRLPRLARGYAIGVSSFFVDPGRFDFYEYFQLPESRSLRKLLFVDEGSLRERLARVPITMLATLSLILAFNLAVIAGFGCSLVTLRTCPEARVFIAVLVLYLAAVTSFAGASRYRLAVEPLLLVLAVPCLLRAVLHIRGRLAGRLPQD